MAIADVFDTTSGAFTQRSLTNALMKTPFTPNFVRGLNIFKNKGSKTVGIMIEEMEGVLQLIGNERRGAPPKPVRHSKRKVRTFECLHLPVTDRILADDLQGRRLFGSETESMQANVEVAKRLQQIRSNYEVTFEHLMMGALSGNIVDADGSTSLVNLFTEFGIAQTVHDMDFGTPATDPLSKALGLKRLMESALGNDRASKIIVLCSPSFFDALIGHADVKTAFERWQTGAFLRTDQRTGFEFPNGVEWVEYDRAVNTVGSVDFIADGDARAIPLGVNELFKIHFAPGQSFAAVNTIGQEFYASQSRDPHDKWIELETESNPLPLCHRPACLIRVHSST